MPAEVLLQITKLVTDLRSLHSLALAEPAIYRLWGVYGTEILLAITSNRLLITPQLRDLIWLVALLRSTEMPAWSLDTFIERFVKPTMIHNNPPEPPCVVPAPKSCSFSVLGTASRIHDLTQLCLEYYLEKLRGVQPRLRRLAEHDSSFYIRPFGPYDLLVPGWRRHANGTPSETPYMGAASWIEEQIVLRAFWRLQLLYDFKQAAQKSQLTTWPHSDTVRIINLRVDELYPEFWPHLAQYHEIISVCEYLQGGNENSSLPKSLPARKVNIRIGPHNMALVARYIGVRSLYAPEGLSMRDYVHVLKAAIGSDESPIKGASFALFRCYGFALWDTPRLAALKLCDRQFISTYLSNYWYSWRSLLSTEELAAVERRLAAEEGEKRKRSWEIYERNVNMGRDFTEFMADLERDAQISRENNI
ncbi:hypothetical protein V493_07200 [Pseudogymnoascus sp. VKM F-4281 (FW-2241)]|nr:hypothetical protein V493_07200 [Pseudogymnoascus sp. VKM F-4281 (FW-2241)]